VLRVVLTLFVETALALDELFAIKVRDGTEDRFREARIGE
jgi:hypothetical protein